MSKSVCFIRVVEQAQYINVWIFDLTYFRLSEHPSPQLVRIIEVTLYLQDFTMEPVNQDEVNQDT